MRPRIPLRIGLLAQQASRFRPQLLILVHLVVVLSLMYGVSPAQGGAIPPGWVLMDDMILPVDVVYGEATYSATPWPGGVVYYDFDANVAQGDRTRTLDAMAEWAAVASVTFVPRTNQSNYVHVISGSGNSSYVGMIGGSQNLTMFNWSWRFIICHELCHALGFWHEQQRPDRNSFVQINVGNVDPAYASNFNLITGAVTYGTYDFDSVMHYDQYAFSSNAQPTITVLPPNQAWQNLIGHVSHLSVLDAQGMAIKYGPPPVPAVVSISPNGVFTGASGFTLTVNGSSFHAGGLYGQGVAGTVIRWNGSALSTTYVSSTQLTAFVPAGLVATAGTVSVTVVNPAPGGGVSSPQTFTVNNSVPVLTLVQPNAVTVGAISASTTLTGSGFVPQTQVRWNNSTSGVTRNWISPTQMFATFSASLLVNAGVATITVDSPTPGGGTSSGLTFVVSAPPGAQSEVVGWGDQVFNSSWNQGTFAEVKASVANTVARRSDGSVVVWGDNQHGQCNVPALLFGLNYFVQVAAGGGHVAARRSNGLVAAWGDNGFGQCNVPSLPFGLSYVQVAAGRSHTVARRSDGSVVAWGDNTFGQCSVPALPPGLSYVEVTADREFLGSPFGAHTVARRSDGSVVAWGSNSYGQCNVPSLPPGLSYVEVAAGRFHTLARRSDGSVVGWGFNGNGECNVPALPLGLTYVSVAAGSGHNLALRSDGACVGWGWNYYGQCLAPPLPSGLSYVEVGAGEFHSVARRSDGSVVAWGGNHTGQCNVPPQTPTLSYVELAAGQDFTVARRSDGTVAAWGNNNDGQCNVVALPPGLSYVGLAAGYGHTIARRSDGSVMAWGSNANGQCNVPILSPGLSYVDIAAGAAHSVARRSDGSVAAWGLNNYGQCSVPPLPAGLSYAAVAAGFGHTVACRSDGAVVAWGWNYHGQCNVPALPLGLSYVEVAAGFDFTVARRSDGSVVAWGWNTYGQCNVPVLAPGVCFVELAAGDQHALARRSDGSLVAWGRNDSGQCNVPALPLGLSHVEVAAKHNHTASRLGNSTASSPQFQTNSAPSSLAVDGVQGTAWAPAVSTKAQGAPVSLQFTSINLGLGWEAIVALGPLVSSCMSGLQTPHGQILNVNPASPALTYLNGGTTPGLVPFVSNVSLAFPAPAATITFSLQSLHLDPAHPDGLVLSQGSQLVVP